MKRALAFTLIAVVTVFVMACHKNSSGPSAGYGPQSLFPTTAGDTWYYSDSSFTDTITPGTVTNTAGYLDTMVATKTAYQDPATGLVFLEMNNPYGWFDGAFIAVDATNDQVYELDSPAYQSYVMFALVNQDGPIANQSVDYTNPACPVYYNQIGYASPVQEYNNSCYKNVELITNCNNVVLEQTNYWLSPGVGVVRIEDWVTDTTGGKNLFYEDYSQTLTSKTFQ
jgi:hypothetical protein